MKKLLTTMLIATALQLLGQENVTYQLPPAEILQLADFERPPGIMMDHERKYVILSYRNTYKTLNDLNQEEMRLGGLRINPATNISSTITYITNLKLRKATEKEPRQVSGLPQNPQIGYMLWSPNEEKIAFTNTSAKGVELWVLDVSSASAVQVTGATLNANMGNPITWFTDSKNLLVRMLPSDRPALIDYSNSLPLGPVVSTTTGEVSQNRTYQDLLKNPTDEKNFENLITSQIYKINIDKTAQLLFDKAMYVGETFSPDGNYIMITTLHKPFSYIVPLSRFPKKTTIYSNTGKLVAEVDASELIEIMPKGFMATTAGKRGINWRSDKPATLYYVQALDEGDPAKEVPHRDALYTLEAPFSGHATQIAKTVQRFGGIIWGEDDIAIMYDNWYDTRNQRTYLFSPSQIDHEPKVIADRNYQDIYSDPGSFQTRRNQYQRQVLAVEDGSVFLVGDGYSEKGQFPFIDKMELSNQKTTRLYQSKDKNRMERIMSIEDYKKGTMLVQLQSKTEYPNYYFRDIKTGKLNAITAFKNPFESLNKVHKEVINYTRADGVALSGTLYLPPGYDKKKKERLPLLIWAYPREFKDKNSAGQSTANPNEFTFPYYGSFVYWVMRGYVVLDDASFPIVGEGDNEPNDNFVQQLMANAEAAINAVNDLGYINTKKVAVGGHSYGAFMTANLLTYSNLFACGIARSGAYNRTLTPFGFQSEQRNYWDVPEVYNTMSPFMNADKMKTPMLLVHGEADNNPGTFTLQTERYFQALKGLGAPARMVILPKESHGYVARENIMHLLWEQDQFLEKYLKDAPAK